MKKFCESLGERTMKMFNFKNEVINNQTAGII